jgi:ribonuclease Z
MAHVVLLGTSAAVPTTDHALTSVAVEGEGGFLLVDCGDNPVPRMPRAGLAPDHLQGLLLTHFHPDHAAGVPLLLVDLWLLGRQEPLRIFGPQDALDRLLAVMDLFRWGRWEGLYPVVPVTIEPQTGARVLEEIGLRVSAAPAEHVVPAIGFRFEALGTGRVAVYSGDTAPCPAFVELARGADWLFHEATGGSPGHSSPAQAGEVARQADAKRLVLIHYPPDPSRFGGWLAEARAAFGGPVQLGQDFQDFPL